MRAPFLTSALSIESRGTRRGPPSRSWQRPRPTKGQLAGAGVLVSYRTLAHGFPGVAVQGRCTSPRPPGKTRTTHGPHAVIMKLILTPNKLLRRPPPCPLSYGSFLHTGRRALPLLLLRRHRRLPTSNSFGGGIVGRKRPVRRELF